jgi:hypothetical protein
MATKGEIFVNSLTDMDPELKQVLIALNDAGFRTISSCAGHPNVPFPRGSISLSAKQYSQQEQNEVKRILARYKLPDLKIEFSPSGSTEFTFAPIGRPKTSSELEERKRQLNAFRKRMGREFYNKIEPGDWRVVNHRWVKF